MRRDRRDAAVGRAETFRTRPAIVVGVLVAIGAVVIAALTGWRAIAAGRHVLGTVAVLVAVLSGVWVVLIRPMVRVGPDGVLLRNLVTDVEIPFSRLAEVKHRWALELVDRAGEQHSSWAVPVRRQLRREAVEDFAESTGRGGRHEGVHAEWVAGQVHRHWQRWKLNGGRVEQRGAADRRIAWSGLAPLVAAVGLAIAALLL